MSMTASQPPADPMSVLAAGSDTHAKMVKFLKDRLETSERKMGNFYPRWRVNERKVQGYVNLPDYEKIWEEGNKKGAPPKVVSIQIPYSFAVIQTIVTYLIHTFCGRQPIFQVGTYNEMANEARNMEIMLQYNCDHSKIILQIYEMLMSSQVYQFGAVRVGWVNEYKNRTLTQQIPTYDMYGMPGAMQTVASRQQRLVYSGNTVDHIDPFLFFPDPNVPMSRVNRDGDFVFWRSFRSNTWLLEQRNFKNTQQDFGTAPESESGGDNSDRSLRAMGDGLAGRDKDGNDRSSIKMLQIDEGTVKIIPSQWGLSPSEVPEKWLFTMVNKKTIVRAEPLEADHDLHPVAVIEPNAIGSQFGSISMADVVGPVQDHISWLLNSHMQNVRGVINNRLVVNPHYLHMEDLKKDPGSGEDGSWLLRMKQSAFGVKPDQAVYQLGVQDVTSGHIKNVELMIRIGHMFAGVNDNLMGLQDSSGRKTATEVRTSGEAGASRLAAMARVISAQGLSDLPYMMGMNLQQRIDPEFYMRVLGQKAQLGNIQNADFYYPINDGTLPLDRAMLLQVWTQILQGVAADPELRSVYSLPQLFGFVADLGGARNIDQFKVEVKPDAQIEQGLASGQLAALGQQPG